MKFNLNKNKYSGGLYFGSIIAIVSILDCCAEVRTINNNDISDIINLFNNISWRIIANNKIVDADENNWITQEKYNESIIKVIAQAVADCITDKNEFKFKGEGDVIMFDAEAKDYTAENWNAVVLWNYLHVLKWNYLKSNTRSKDVVFDEVRRRIYGKYQTAGVNDFDRKVDEAISDIKEYDKELSLADEMKKFYRCCKKVQGKTIDELIRENNGSWMPVGQVGIRPGAESALAHICKLENGRVLWSTYMKCDEATRIENKRRFRPIKIKESHRLHYICDYTFNVYANTLLCDIEEEVVKYFSNNEKHKEIYKNGATNYVLLDDNILIGALEKLFSDLKMGYVYSMGYSLVLD